MHQTGQWWVVRITHSGADRASVSGFVMGPPWPGWMWVLLDDGSACEPIGCYAVGDGSDEARAHALCTDLGRGNPGCRYRVVFHSDVTV